MSSPASAVTAHAAKRGLLRRCGAPCWPPAGSLSKPAGARLPGCRVLSAGSPPSLLRGLRSCARGCGPLPTLAISCVSLSPSPEVAAARSDPAHRPLLCSVGMGFSRGGRRPVSVCSVCTVASGLSQTL